MSELGSALIKHTLELRRYAKALVNNSADADDLVQECLMKTLEKCPSWRSVRNPRAYLFSVLHNVYVDKMNGARVKMTEIDPEGRDGALVSPPAQLDKMALHDLESALQKLPAAQREVVLLVGLQGMNYREAADVLKVPLGTVMSRLSRGRETLRALLNGHVREPMRRVK